MLHFSKASFIIKIIIITVILYNKNLNHYSDNVHSIIYKEIGHISYASLRVATVLPFLRFGKEFPAFKECGNESRKVGKEFGNEF